MLTHTGACSQGGGRKRRGSGDTHWRPLRHRLLLQHPTDILAYLPAREMTVRRQHVFYLLWRESQNVVCTEVHCLKCLQEHVVNIVCFCTCRLVVSFRVVQNTTCTSMPHLLISPGVHSATFGHYVRRDVLTHTEGKGALFGHCQRYTCRSLCGFLFCHFETRGTFSEHIFGASIIT